MPTSRLAHAFVHVRDLERTVAFYAAVFRMRRSNSPDTKLVKMRAESGADIVLQEVAQDLACAIGCDPTPSGSREIAVPTPIGTRAAKPRTQSQQPSPPPVATTLAAVRDRGELVEIELVFARRLPGGDLPPPVLRIDDEVVRASFHPGGQLDRLVFRVPKAQFERLPDGAAMTVTTRGLTSAKVALDKRGMVSP